MKKADKKILLPSLLILLAAGIRLFRLDHWSLWYDELYTVWASRLPLKPLLREVMASGHPPLYYLGTHVWFELASGGTWVRLISWGAGVGTVFLVYLIGGQLLSRRARLWATALAALSPALVWYARDATSYSFVAFLATLSFYFLVRTARGGGWYNWAAFTAAAGALSLTFYFFPILLAAGWPVWWLLHDRRKGGAAWWLGSQGMLIAVTAALMLLANSGTAPHWLVLTAPNVSYFARGAVEMPLALAGGGWLADNLNYRGATLGLSLTWITVVVMAALALVLALVAGPARMRRRLASRETAALAAYGIVLIFGSLLLESMLARIPTVRYYLWAAPVVSLLAGAVLAAVPRKTSWVLGGAALLLLAGFTTYELNWNDNLDGNWRGLMARISAERQPGDELLCFPLHMCTVAADFYLDNPPPIAGGFPLIGADAVFTLPKGDAWAGYRSGYFTGMGQQPPLSGPALDNWVNQVTAGAGRIWLIAFDDDLTTPDLKRDLGEHWRLAQEWRFSGQPLALYIRDGG